MDYRVLGPLEALSETGEARALGGIKQRTVLAYLLMRHNQVVSTDRLIEATWGDDPPASPRSALQTYISRLRKALGDDIISAKDPGYVLRIGPDDLDAAVFERLVADGRRAADLGHHDAAVERFDAALDLWNGDAYADFAYAEFARGERERLEGFRLTTIEDRFEAMLAQGRHREAIPGLDRALEDHPFRERLWGLSMIALYRDGRQAEALRAYRRAAAILGDELGIEPGPELRDIEERVLLNDPSLSLSQPSSRSPLPEGDVAFLVATHASGPRAWDVFAAEVADHGGAVVGETSDQRLAVFVDVGPAMLAAIDAQRHASAGGQGLSLAVHATEAYLRRGEYVGNGVSRATRLATAAAPGQILVSAGAAQASPPLPEPALVERLDDIALPGMSSAEAVYQIRHPDVAAATARTAATNRTNLAAGGLTSFVGRDAEIQEVRAFTEQHRLVTITGPGGVGKTRLAYQVAADLVGRHPGGVWLIELASLEPEHVMPKLLTTVGIETFPDEEPVDAVARHAAQGRLFFVFDNCEHLIDAAADMVTGLLRATEHVRILTTSRERLGVPGEFVFQLSGLAVPTADAVVDADALASSEAVALFIERARNVRSGFSLDPSMAHAVATVCRRLDGIPLALELAASRLDVLTPLEIAGRLDDRFRLLVTRARGIPARQQTLEAVLDWSYDLLEPDEQTLLRRLAVFRGPFDLAAVESVCTGEPVRQRHLLDVLSALVAKNLVTTRTDGEATSYLLLETIHAYARRLLDESGESDRLGAAHADHYRSLAREWSEHQPPVVNPAWSRLVAQLDNVRAALEWIEHHQSPEMMAAMVADLQWFWLFRSLTAEGLGWTRHALDVADDELRVRLLRGAGPLAAEEGHYRDAETWTRESLVHWQATGRVVDAASDLNNLAVMAQMQGRPEEALALVDEAIAAIEASRDDETFTLHKLSGSYMSRAEILCEVGRLAEAADAARRALDLQTTIDTDSYLHHDVLRVMGRITLDAGHTDDAEDWYRQAADVGADLGADFTARAHNGLAAVALVRGNHEAALEHVLAAVELLDPASTDRLESLRLLSLTHLLEGDAGRAEPAALEMLSGSVGGGGDRWLAAALEVAGLSAAAAGNVERGAVFLCSGRRSQDDAGIRRPAWHAEIVARIGDAFGFDADRLATPPNDDTVLSPSEAARLALGAS